MPSTFPFLIRRSFDARRSRQLSAIKNGIDTAERTATFVARRLGPASP